MTKPYEDDRRRSITLDEKDVDEFIDRAVNRAVDRFYAEVGKSVLKRVAWIVGACAVGIYVFLKHKGVL